MDFLFPLTAIVSESTAKTIDKLNLAKNHIATTHLMRLVFVGMTVSLFAYIIVADKPLPEFSFVALGLMLLIASVSFVGNVFDYLSLKADDLSLREPMMGYEPILAGLFGYLFFASEREAGFLAAFLLSTVVVYFGTHQRRLGKRQREGMVFLLLALVLYALLPSIYKLTLPYISPEYISFFRVASILVLASIFMPIKRHLRSTRKMAYGLTAGVIYAIGSVASLYAIEKLGVAQTMLLLLLSPALIYLSGYFILKERVRTGEITSSVALVIIVLGSITLA